MHLVLDHHLTVLRILEANSRRRAGARLKTFPAPTVVARLLLGGQLGFTHRLQFRFGAVATVRFASRQKLRQHGAVAVKALRLKIWPFIDGQSQPPHAVDDYTYGLLRGSLPISV